MGDEVSPYISFAYYSENLLKRYIGPFKVLRQLGDLNYEVMADETTISLRRQPRPEIVYVVHLKP